MKNKVGLLLVFILSLALVACQSSAAQERHHVIETSELPRAVVAFDDKVTLFVAWDNIKEIELDGIVPPFHSTMMYTVNRTDQSITIRRSSRFDGNSVLEFENKDKKWQRTTQRNRQWGACGTGQSVNEFQLLPGQCLVEPVVLQKIGKMETVRFRLVADGKNYYSNPHRLPLQIDPRVANASEQDDWAITYGTTDLLRRLINDEIKFARPPIRFVP